MTLISNIDDVYNRIQIIMEGGSKQGNNGRNKKKQLKRAIMQQINALKPSPDATPDQAIQALVKQAEFYTNFLISGYDMKKNQQKKDEKRRGHFLQEQEEERELLQQQDQQNQQLFTRLQQQPSNLKGGKLKYYQLVGLNWMISLYQSGLNGILADDMGLGKTIQTISILAFLREYKKIKGPHIVIAPKITLGNWKNQFQKWLPQCKVVKLIATKQERTEILANSVATQKFDVLITSFEGVRICLSHLKNIKWHYIVIDEAHKIKNQQSKLSQLVRKLNNQCKLLLTGTPLQNNLHELWSLLNFLLPQIFDSSQMFDNWFDSKKAAEQGGVEMSDQQIEKKNVHMIQQLHKILKPFMLRRTKLEVEKTLPGKKQIHIFVGLTDVQLKVYKSLLQNRAASEQDKKVYLNLLMQLRKVCNHPYLFQGVQATDAPSLGEHIVESCGKMIVLDKLLKKLKAQGGHQVLIFSQMTMVLDILEDYCNFRQFKYCRIDGSTDMTSRDEQIQDFMNPNTDKFVFLLSTRAGGLGINLTSADTVIIYDSDWNPQMDLQAMDRAHRIGQKNIVNVYRLITENTIEQKIIERQLVKLKWDNLVIQQAKNSSQKNKSLTKEQIKDMLQYGASITLKAEKGTFTDEQIDKILERGETKTNQMNKALDEKIKKPENLTDFSMNSINIFDFMMNDEKQKKQDQQALDEVMARMLQNDAQILRTRRLKNVNYQFDSNSKKDNVKPERKINLPEYHFYDQRQRLIQLLEKQEDYLSGGRNADPPKQPLTEEQQAFKTQLLSSGFKSWLKSDFNNFISASERYGRDNIEQIAKLVGKDIDQVKEYHQRFWERLNELSQKQRILKQIQTGQDKIANKKHNSELLEWKASKCYEIDFNPQIYTKFKSKLFTIDADRFLAQSAYKYGLKNMSMIRDKIRSQPMFRFDFHFRSRTQSQLNKRLQSLYKLIQKQKDMAEYGFDNEMFKQSKKKYKKKKQQNKQNQFEVAQQAVQQDQVNSSQDNDQEQEVEASGKKPRKVKPKQRQALITNYRRPPETIEIDENQEMEG